MIRPWRLALETPVALENIKGYSSALWVHEVSFKGVLVEVRGRVKPPKTFSCGSALPATNASPCAVRWSG